MFLVAVEKAAADIVTHGTVTASVARQVHDSLLVSLVTALHLPPCRLSVIQTLIHPDFIAAGLKCTDPDCTKPGCLGNRLELMGRAQAEAKYSVLSTCNTDQVEAETSLATPANSALLELLDYESTSIVTHVIHSKTERHSSEELSYLLPRGTMTVLMLLHVRMGHMLLTQEIVPAIPNLFLKRNGCFNSPPVFTQYWQRLMTTCPIARELQLAYFAPQKGRTVFVEGYTSMHGVAPEFWDGAACIMGNTTTQWRASYNPSRKRRLAQMSIQQHNAYVSRLCGQAIHIAEPQADV